MKFTGKVGFWLDDVETAPGVFQHKIVEKTYFGDVSTNTRRWQEADQQNDQMRVNNSISILSDLFARRNYASIRYVIWDGARLKVNSVVVNYPRLTLEIGGLYNGENAPDTP